MARRNPDLLSWQPKNMFGGEFTPFRDLWQTVAGEAGITTKLMRKNAAEYEAYLDATQRDLDSEIQSLMPAMGTDVDRLQLQAAADENARLINLARHARPEDRAAILQKLQGGGGLLEDLESRQEKLFDDGVNDLDSQAEYLRANRTTRMSELDDIDSKAAQIHQILNSGEDINNPLIRGQLTSLLDSTSRQFQADPTGFDDVLSAVGGGLTAGGSMAAGANPRVGLATAGLGAALQAFAAGADAADFKWTKEQWRGLALAAETYNSQARQRILDATAQRAMELDEHAAAMGHTPSVSYVDRVVWDERPKGERRISNRPYASTGGDEAPGTEIPAVLRDVAEDGASGAATGAVLGGAAGAGRSIYQSARNPVARSFGGRFIAGRALSAAGAGALTGGVPGAIAGAAIGAAMDIPWSEQLDAHIGEVAASQGYTKVFETENGAIVNEYGDPIDLPRGLMEQAKRRAQQRRRATQRETNGDDR
jgi:hypothetical protein